MLDTGIFLASLARLFRSSSAFFWIHGIIIPTGYLLDLFDCGLSRVKPVQAPWQARNNVIRFPGICLRTLCPILPTFFLLQLA